MIQTFGTFTKNRGENLFFMPAGAAWEEARKFGFGEKLRQHRIIPVRGSRSQNFRQIV